MVYLAELLVVMTDRLNIVRLRTRNVHRVHGHKHLDNDMSLSLQKSDSVTCSMHRGAIMLKHKKIVSGQPLHVWQQEICHYAIFTLTPNVSDKSSVR